MRLFLWNLLLAFAWAALNADISLFSLTVGFVIGFFVLALALRGPRRSDYRRRVLSSLGLITRMSGELFLSGLRVAHDVLTRRHRMRPGVIAVPLDARTDMEILLLANLISLTPGSLTLDVSEDRSTMFLHVMYLDEGNVDAYVKRIKDQVERRVLEVLR